MTKIDIGHEQLDEIKRIAPFVVIVAGLIYLFSTMRVHREVTAEEVAVKVNYLSGRQEIISQPGIKFYIPIIEEIFVLDKTPNKFLMAGDVDRDANHVQKLTVRANDGSNFWFESLEIQYQIVTADADKVLNESGVGSSFKQFWIRSMARSVLRDEFGRFSVEEVTDPTKYGVAIENSRRRLNTMLEPHGIAIIQVISPKPKFNDDYEQAIEQRKVANQEVERLKAQREKLDNAMKTQLAAVDREREMAREQLMGVLQSAKLNALKERDAAQRTADAYAITRETEAKALLRETEINAKALRVKYESEIDGLRKEISAYAENGRRLVWREYATKIAGMSVDAIPYQADPSPERIELGEPGVRVLKEALSQ